jgi:alpha-L-fucosidase
MNTPFKRDITKEIVEAFRKEGIAIGLYFSPEDFLYFYQHKIPIGRLQHPQHYPTNNTGLMEYDKKQLKELFTNYGKIDILFIDGPGDGLREYAWSFNPDLVITRDLMKTPEQNTPNEPLPRPWEACYTMGTDWGYKPTNDPHNSGTQVINMLTEIRAKGGNFLLNIGPKPNGEIQIEQESILQEVALWNFANSEAIYKVKPLPVIREENVWYVQSNDEKYIYATVTRSSPDDWKYGDRKAFVLTHIEGNAKTEVSILGFKGEMVEYKKDFDAKTYISPTPIGLVISAVNGQRFYTNNKWPNAVVLKIENAKFRKLNTLKSTQSLMDGAK